MRKILTHFSRIFAKIAKEIKYFNLPTYSAIHFRRFVYTKSCNFPNITYIWNPNIFTWNWSKVFIAIKIRKQSRFLFPILSVISTFLLKRLRVDPVFTNYFSNDTKILFFTLCLSSNFWNRFHVKKRKENGKSLVVHMAQQLIWRKNVQLRPGLRNWFHEKKKDCNTATADDHFT